MSLPQLENKWYREGLLFKCTGCGKCCTGFPGNVWLTEDDILRIISYLKISVDEFAERYVKVVEGRLSLRETLPHYDCVFYKDKLCTIYPVRPTQCATYPFWPALLESEEAWEKEAMFCEGINHKEADKISSEKILDQLQNPMFLDSDVESHPPV